MMIRATYLHIAIAGFLLFLTISAYGLWFRHVSQRSAQAAALSLELKAQGEFGGRASSMRRALENVEQAEAGIYRYFVGSDTIVTYLEEVETTGRNLGAVVEVVSVGNAQSREGQPTELQMLLRVTGSFDAVMRTLGAIEYQAYDTKLTGLTLDTPPSENSEWTAAVTFVVGMPPTP